MNGTSSTASRSVVPELCDPQDTRENVYCLTNDSIYEWALATFSNSVDAASNNGGDVGLARDGHVIKGPYNEDGELWDCDDHDVCNGTFMEDGSYVYVTTKTFPYVVGCWGPGPKQTIAVSSDCSSSSCDLAHLSVFIGAASFLFAALTF